MKKVNELEVNELRGELRKKETTCWNCERHVATDVHHLNGIHKDNRPSNLAPWCKRCHNEHHRISDNLTELGLLVAEHEDIQKMRIAMGNRIFAYNNLGYDVETSLGFKEGLRDLEDQVANVISQNVKDIPIYKEWLRHVKGIGPIRSAKLLAYIKSPDKFPTVSSLWAYSGTAVINGEIQKRKSGTTANWNHNLKKLVVNQVPDGFVRCRSSFGRKLYDQYKKYYLERGDAKSNGHADNRARRKVGKVFLACLWAKWRELEGLPARNLYVEEYLGHTSIITWEEWMQ